MQKVSYSKYSIIALVALSLVFALVIIEKTGVTNFYSKPISEDKKARPINDTKYTPATTTEKEEGERIKAEAQQKLESPSNKAKIDVNLSIAGQDEAGGPLLVKSLINGAVSGQCSLKITNTSTTKTFTADVINLGTYYGCDGFSVPFQELSRGKYIVNLEVSNSTASGLVTQEVEIN